MNDEKLEVPDWVWTSDVVLGWCDSAGCQSLGHKTNNCRLARVFAAHLNRRAPSPVERAKDNNVGAKFCRCGHRLYMHVSALTPSGGGRCDKCACAAFAYPDEQFDYETGECTHGLIGNYSTCNGSEKGCCREWGLGFEHCCYHLKKEWAAMKSSDARAGKEG